MVVEETLESVNQYAQNYFRNCDYTPLMQLILAFALGVIFAPYSYGFAFFFVFLVVYEFFYATFTNLQDPFWSPFLRISVVAVSLFGWIIGRYIVGWVNPLRDDPNAS